MPITNPKDETRIAAVEFFSFLDLAIAPNIIPAGPKIIGSNRNAIPPQIKEAME
jgi:hypothetical protein